MNGPFKARALGSSPSRLTKNQPLTQSGLSNESPLDIHWTLCSPSHSKICRNSGHRAINVSIDISCQSRPSRVATEPDHSWSLLMAIPASRSLARICSTVVEKTRQGRPLPQTAAGLSFWFWVICHVSRGLSSHSLQTGSAWRNGEM